MTSDTIQAIAKYVVAVVVLIGAFAIIGIDTPQHLDATAPWGVIGLIVGWIVRDSAGQSATSNAVKITAAAQPNGPPA